MFRSALLNSIIFITSVSAIPKSIWTVDIFEGPAPPPDKGPPLSAGATRDRSKRKYEVIGIVGAYLAWSLVTIILILFVGKKLRRKAQTSNRTLSMEMLKSPRALMAPTPSVSSDGGLRSPKSPRSPTLIASLRSWTSGGKGHNHKKSSASMSTVDERILETDKARNMDEMTKLYAAVMAHDEEKSQRARSSSQTSPQSLQKPAQDIFPTPPLSPQQPPPPEFQHLRERATSPRLPRGQALSHPLAPTPIDEDFYSNRSVKASPLSFISQARTDSSNSNKRRPSRISIRGIPISQPIASADLRESSQEAVDGPMSPRIYSPGRPPPTPGQASILSQTPGISHPRDEEKNKPATAMSVSTATAANSKSNLPFRQFYGETLKSAPATKTTFLDRRESALAPQSRTGLPPTPYSAYMPYTPMTPVTPRKLLNREELKKRKKEGMKVLSEDDMVMSEEDMWGEVK